MWLYARVEKEFTAKYLICITFRETEIGACLCVNEAAFSCFNYYVDNLCLMWPMFRMCFLIEDYLLAL